MEGTHKFVARKCCPGGTREFHEPTDLDPTLVYRHAGEVAPAVKYVDERPLKESTAWHESGHAVFGFALGMPIELIRASSPALVRFQRGNNLTAAQRISIDFAGPIGEMARVRCWSTVSAADEEEHLRRVEAGGGGGCDECQMAKAAWLEVGLPAGFDAAREVFREGQLLALRIGQSRDVQQAIRALAAELMHTPTMSGKRAHSIIEPFIKFGELANAETH